MASCLQQVPGRGDRLPGLWSELHHLPPRSPAPPEHFESFHRLIGPRGCHCPRTASEEGPRVAGLSLALGHIGHSAPVLLESFFAGFEFTNMGAEGGGCFSYSNVAELVNFQANSIRDFALPRSVCLQDKKMLGLCCLVPSAWPGPPFAQPGPWDAMSTNDRMSMRDGHKIGS